MTGTTGSNRVNVSDLRTPAETSQKTALDGGSPVVLCHAPDVLAASWSEDNFIFAACAGNRLWRVPASGGPPFEVPAVAGEAVRVISPQVLPGNQAVLFTAVVVAGADQAAIEVLSLATGKIALVAQGGTYGKYLPSGHLVYIRQGTLYAVSLDLNHLEMRSSPTAVVDGISYDSTFGCPLPAS